MAYGTGAYRTGRCLNDLYCAAASAKQDIQVPVGRPFVCAQCGKALSEPPLEKRKFGGPALVACGILAATGGALFVVGAMIGKGRPADAMVVQASAPRAEASSAAPVPPPVLVPAPTAVAKVMAAPTSGAGPSQLAPAASEAAKAPDISQALPPPAPAPPKLAMVQTAPSAAELQARTETAELAQARENARRQARAAVLAKRAEAALAAQKLAAVQAQDARKKMLILKQEADEELQARRDADAARAAQAARVAQAQAQALAQAQAGDQRARLASQAARAPLLAAAPAATKGPTRGFSAAAISGGAPSYPSAYDDGRSGRVTVSCLIAQSGSPSGCHVVASQGGIGFSNAALGWLQSGQVRFAPILRDGQTRSEEHSWTMNFVP